MPDPDPGDTRGSNALINIINTRGLVRMIIYRLLFVRTRRTKSLARTDSCLHKSCSDVGLGTARAPRCC